MVVTDVVSVRTMIATKDKDYVIFRNYPSKGYWEVISPHLTTYIMYEIIKEDDAAGMGAMALMIMLHHIPNIGEICMTILEYMKNPQEDMFLVEI